MYFNICDEVSIRTFNLKGKKTILIRILEPSYLISGIPYNICNIEKYAGVLELYIKDTVVSNERYENVFDYEKAKILNEFILSHDFDEVVVHCSLGISRSPAIMICIAKILNNYELETLIKEKYKNYNSYIVQVFENSNYIVKNLGSPITIDGNILDERINKEIAENILILVKNEIV